MKKGLLLLSLLLTWAFTYAQNSASRAQVLIPQGTEFSRGQIHQLQIEVAGLDPSQEYLRSKSVEIRDVQGIIDFTLVMEDNNTNGHIDVRFAVDTRDEFVNMLREIFCRLNLGVVFVNDTPFQNCRMVNLPSTL